MRILGVATVADLARALGVDRTTLYGWDEPWDVGQTDRVIGAAMRLGRLSAAEASEMLSPADDTAA